MREILFKGFHPCEDGKEMIWIDGKKIRGYWVLANSIIQQDHNHKIFLWERKIKNLSDGTKEMTDHLVEVIPKTVGQYTGVPDKFGDLVFEGDYLVVMCGQIDEDDGVGCVEWDEDELEWILVFEGFMTPLSGFVSSDMTLKGSCFSNPELMEVTHKC